MPIRDTLLNRIVTLGSQIPGSLLDRLCDGLEGLPADAESDQWEATARDISDPEVRAVLVRLLLDFREKGAGRPPSLLAWALRASKTQGAVSPVRQTLQTVWSGPARRSTTSPSREQALLGLVREARRSLWLVTAAVAPAPVLGEALLAAAKRGVEVVLILESSSDDDFNLPALVSRSLGPELAAHVRILGWSPERRMRDPEGRLARLNVRCAIADARSALVSCSDLIVGSTGLDMELGLLVRDGDLPRTLSDHLRSLVEHGVLTPCP